MKAAAVLMFSYLYGCQSSPNNNFHLHRFSPLRADCEMPARSYFRRDFILIWVFLSSGTYAIIHYGVSGDVSKWS